MLCRSTGLEQGLSTSLFCMTFSHFRNSARYFQPPCGNWIPWRAYKIVEEERPCSSPIDLHNMLPVLYRILCRIYFYLMNSINLKRAILMELSRITGRFTSPRGLVLKSQNCRPFWTAFIPYVLLKTSKPISCILLQTEKYIRTLTMWQPVDHGSWAVA